VTRDNAIFAVEGEALNTGFRACGITPTGPVLLGDDGNWWVGLFGGLGRFEPGDSVLDCTTFEYEEAQDRSTVGLLFNDVVVAWTGTHLLFDADPSTGTTVDDVVPVPTPGDVPHAGTFVVDDKRGLHLLLGAPSGASGPRARIAYSVDMARRTLGNARAPVDAILGTADVAIATDVLPGQMVASFGGATSQVTIFPANAGLLSSGDRPFAIAADPLRDRVLVAGPAGFLAEFRRDGARLLTPPRLPTIFRVVEGVGGEVWGIGGDAVFHWADGSVLDGGLPDAVFRVDLVDTVGLVPVAAGTAIVRSSFAFDLVEAEGPAVTRLRTQAESQPVDSSGRGDPGFANDQLVELQVSSGVEVVVVVHRLLPQDRSRRTAVQEILIEEAGLITAAIAPDASAIALMTGGAGAVAIKRCAVTVGNPTTVSPCTTLGTVPHDDAANLDLSRVQLRHTADGIVGALPAFPETAGDPGVVFAAVAEGPLVSVPISASFLARTDVRTFGRCVLTSFSTRVVAIDLDAPEAFTVVPVDGEVRSIVGVGSPDEQGFAFAAGGAESFAGTTSAGQLYRIPLAGCVPDAEGITVPGGARSQADLIGVGARSDGAVIVGDAVDALWSVTDVP
jgi:hypothetical protein